jgi:hypothetical protein
MSDAPRIVLRPNPSITTEQVRDARARAWAYVFRCWQEKQKAVEPAPEPDSRNDVRKGQDAHTTNRNNTG